MRTRLLSPCLAVAFAGGIALADPSPDDQDKIDLSQILGAVSGQVAAGAPGSQAALPDFAAVTKDMRARSGLFTLWYYPKGAKDKDPEKLLCQIPAAFLGEKFMLSTSFSGGGFFTGFPLDERVVQWELLGNQLLLVEPETRFVINKSESVADAVRRTYPDRIRTAVPLVTKSPQGDPVIDLGDLLKSDFADIGWMAGLGGLMPGGGINSGLSRWSKKKAFELNVEIGVELAVRRMQPPGSYDKKLVHFSFWKLPKSDYRPRIADDRVGYFLTANRDWAKPVDARDLFNRYVDRWHLVKRDPSLALCEPKQPIIYYIEKTVPVKYRRAVRDGILEWNRAFETIGFSNAVVVRQQTDDNEWKDLDPEDMRYSFFRWIVTGAGFAMGPHRSNPFTGQIYDGDILFDDSMVRYFEQEAEHYLPASAFNAMKQDPVLERFFEANPEWVPAQRPWEQFVFESSDERGVRDAMRRRMYDQGRHLCDYADGMKHQMMLAHTVLTGQPREVKDRFLYEVIKEVVMHEVGHTLGLRHNFKASSIWSLDEIVERKDAGEATTGSVMDYNAALLLSDGSIEGHFVTPTIGPYDYWAIEYGYRPYDGTYKSSAREDEPADADTDEAEIAEPDEPEPAAASGMPEGFSLDNIPPEVLAQIPPHILEAIKSGNLAEMMAGSAPPAGAPAPRMARRPSGPSFGTPVKGEAGMLEQIASRSTEPELAYNSDEDATMLSPDPSVVRFDIGDDPIAWARDRTQLVDERLADLLNWAVDDQESWYHVTNVFFTLMMEKTFILDYVGRYVGGQYFSRAHKGDPDAPAPFVLVASERQRDALAFIEASLYNDEFFALPPDLLNHLAPPRWWHEGTSISFTMDYPVHDMIRVLQWWNLFQRLFPNTLRRIHDAELKTDDPDKVTAAEYLQSIQDACWATTLEEGRYERSRWSNGKPYISDVRRSLQRQHLYQLEMLVRTAPGRLLSPDLHAMVTQSVRDLSEGIAVVLENGSIDFASEAHLQACKSRIDRMLEAELPEYGR